MNISLGNVRSERQTSVTSQTIWQKVLHTRRVLHAPRRVLNGIIDDT